MTLKKIKIQILSSLLLLLPFNIHAFSGELKKFQLSVYVDNAKLTDSFYLEVYPHVFSEANMGSQMPVKTLVAANVNGTFRFQADIDEPTYFILSVGKYGKYTAGTGILTYYLVSPGDSVNIRISHLLNATTSKKNGAGYIDIHYTWDDILFTGRNAVKYECRYNIDKEFKLWWEFLVYKQKQKTKTSNNAKTVFDSAYYSKYPSNLVGTVAALNRQYVFKKTVLDLYREKLPSKEYFILKANLIGETNWKITQEYGVLKGNFEKNADPEQKLKIQHELIKVYKERIKIPVDDISDNILALSDQYLGALSFDAQYAKATYNVEGYYYLKNKFKGLLRDKAITDYLLYNYFRVDNIDKLMADALSSVQSSYCKAILKEKNMGNAPGDVAFNFSLMSSKDQMVNLSDFKGKMVFVDLWYNGCAGCRGFYQSSLSEVEETFANNSNIIFITISIDKDKALWKQVIHYYSSDTSRNVVNLYTNGMADLHPLIRAYKVSAYPHPFLIDPDGKIYKVDGLRTDPVRLTGLIKEALNKYNL